jgi:hypothetical protein
LPIISLVANVTPGWADHGSEAHCAGCNSVDARPKKLAFLNSDQDSFEFVEAVYEALNSKVTIKLLMENPQGKS